MQTLLRLLSTLTPYRRETFTTYFCLLATNGMNLLVPWLIKEVIDQGLAHGDQALLINIGLIILSLALLRGVFGFGQRYLTEWLAQRVAYDLRNQLYEKYQRMSFEFHDRSHTGDLMARATSDAEAVVRFLGNGLLDLVNISVLLLAIIGIMFAVNTTLAVLAMLPIPVLLYITMRFGINQRVLSKRAQDLMGKLSTTLQENLTGVRVVKAFAREAYEVDKFGARNQAYFQSRLAITRAWASNFPFMNFIIAASTAIILWFGGQQVMRGELTIGALVAFNSYVLMLGLPVQRLGFLVNMFGNALASGERLYEIFDQVSAVQESPSATILREVDGLVKFDHVSFAYKDKFVLHDLSFEARPNEVIALMGPTGAGKSSLVNLMPRFYDVTNGRILIDGHDIRQVTLASLRRQLGMVLQDTFLFSTTVHQNIAYSDRKTALEDIIAAAKAARAHDFIMALPDGYETRVGERGITLSGGQRQRIAIARALLMNPRILILDDSLSAVDTETEYLIQQALQTLMAGRTTFIIAQRLITLKNADLILVLDHGRIVQRGTHDELLHEGGLYRKIYDLQLRDQEEVAVRGRVLVGHGERKLEELRGA
jgi:ATP-binding cassette subfamily B protein